MNALCDRLRAPNDVRELALTACRCRKKLASATPEALLDLLKTADAFRRPERFAELLQVARLAAPGVDTARIERALRAAVSGGRRRDREARDRIGYRAADRPGARESDPKS